MIKIIETNLSIDDNNIIQDHQSRVVEVNDWYNYVEEIRNNKSVNRIDILGSLHGGTLPDTATIENFTYDEFHLTCDFTNNFGIKSKKLAYKLD